jgi:hypothetical protein
MFLLSIFKVSGKKYFWQKVSGNINLKLFAIFSKTYVRISPQIVSSVSTIFSTFSTLYLRIGHQPKVAGMYTFTVETNTT